MDRGDYVADRRQYDSQGRQVRHSGGWAILRWDESRSIWLEPSSYYATKAEAVAVLRDERERRRAAAVLGRKGGQAGHGASKARPLSSERAREIRAQRVDRIHYDFGGSAFCGSPSRQLSEAESGVTCPRCHDKIGRQAVV